MGTDTLPQRIHCEKCGTILYEGMDVKTPHEIVQRYDGRCPKCGRRLSSIPINVEIKMLRTR
ncbi:MAG: hypothetical protein ACETVM_04815 [Candidatus Bathyarchaeia archaeon]